MTPFEVVVGQGAEDGGPSVGGKVGDNEAS